MNQHIRTNQELSQVIQEGVRLDALEGAAVAWAYLLAHSVDTATILRVLSSANGQRTDLDMEAGEPGMKMPGD